MMKLTYVHINVFHYFWFQNLRVLKAVGDEKKMEWGKNVIQSGLEGIIFH